MKTFIASLKKPRNMLVFALILCIAGSFFAGIFNTSFYSVKVKKVTFKADHGNITGLLYMPKGAGKDDPRPVIITTHGYLNTKEMQDAPAIEMSRRGYIVLALDMYDHGDSRWSEPIEVGKQFNTFWVYSQFDAAKYMYGQDYVKKDSKGNAYIAVSGHSMGGFSTLAALYMDEMNSLKTGRRMIYAGIPVGADFSYAAAIAKQDQMQAAFGSRTVGIIAAHFDEFFFNKTEEEKTAVEKAILGTVTYKDFAARPSGKAFLGLNASTPFGEADKFYTVSSGSVVIDGKEVRQSEQGKRVIYTPYETHPWNHFSRETTSNLIDFYTTAFNGVISPKQVNASLSSNNQIWWLKEAFSFVALIGFFMLFIPLITILLELPVLNKAKASVPSVVSEPRTTAEKSVYWVTIVMSSLIPAYLYTSLVNKKGEGINLLILATSVIFIAAAIAVITSWYNYASSSFNRNELKAKAINTTVAAAVITSATIILRLLLKKSDNIIKLGKTFNEPITNQIAYWALISGIIAAIITISFYYLNKKSTGTNFQDYGISFNLYSIFLSLVIAVVAVAAGYALLWLTQLLFTTDYRIWTLAVRTFTAQHLTTALRYIPIFFIYYFINAVAINANTRFSNLEGFKGYIVAILLNIGGLLLWLIYQYGRLLFKHVAAYPSDALNGIVLIALAPCLAIAAVYAKKLFKKTGSVWLSAFLNSILFTIITVANTVMFWNFK